MDKNNYNKEVDKLIQNESFISWVKNPKGDNRTFWEGWVADNPGKFAVIEEARHFILSLNFKKEVLPQKEVTKMLDSIHSSTPTRRPITQIFKISRFAAALFLGILAFAGYIYINSLQTKISTQFAEKKNVVLPDGSTVILNSLSELQYSKTWTEDDHREVWIDGEAYFDVTQNPQAGSSTFIVHTDEFDIEVLGTKFNVFDRTEETNVVLESGKIKITNISEENVAEADNNELTPGQQVICKTDKLIKRSVANTEIYTSWKDNKVVFDETPIIRAIEILEKSYGYKITLKDQSLLEKKITGSIPSDDPKAFVIGLGAIFNTSINLISENEFVIGE